MLQRRGQTARGQDRRRVVDAAEAVIDEAAPPRRSAGAGRPRGSARSRRSRSVTQPTTSSGPSGKSGTPAAITASSWSASTRCAAAVARSSRRPSRRAVAASRRATSAAPGRRWPASRARSRRRRAGRRRRGAPRRRAHQPGLEGLRRRVLLDPHPPCVGLDPRQRSTRTGPGRAPPVPWPAPRVLERGQQPCLERGPPLRAPPERREVTRRHGAPRPTRSPPRSPSRRAHDVVVADVGEVAVLAERLPGRDVADVHLDPGTRQADSASRRATEVCV